MKLLRSMTPVRALAVVLLVAANVEDVTAWTLTTRDNVAVAASQNGRMALAAATPRREGIWGTLTLPISPKQVEPLRAHRYDKYFAIIPVLIDIDGFQRQANAKVNESDHRIAVEIDLTSWDDIKRGKTIVVTLPDGKSYKESLTGSRDALRGLEKASF